MQKQAKNHREAEDEGAEGNEEDQDDEIDEERGMLDEVAKDRNDPMILVIHDQIILDLDLDQEIELAQNLDRKGDINERSHDLVGGEVEGLRNS